MSIFYFFYWISISLVCRNQHRWTLTVKTSLLSLAVSCTWGAGAAGERRQKVNTGDSSSSNRCWSAWEPLVHAPIWTCWFGTTTADLFMRLTFSSSEDSLYSDEISGKGGGGANIENFWYTKYYLLKGHISICPKAYLLIFICLNFREGMWDFMKTWYA